ncbi:MAG: phenylacetate--CoA ligase family protein, partial [Candidatus Nanohaloarchaea archaeon]
MEDAGFPADRTALQEVKDRRSQYTVSYAADNSPYYTDLLERGAAADVESAADLSRLPVTTEDDVRQHQPPETDRFLFRVPSVPVRRPFHTSGSTGQPKVLFYSHDDIARMNRSDARALQLCGISGDDVVANYAPYAGLNISHFEIEGAVDMLGASSVPIAQTRYPADVEYRLLERYGATAMTSLPSVLEAKAHKLLDAGHDPAELPIAQLVIGGEPVSDARKERLHTLFGAEVQEIYATSETGIMGYSCPACGNTHILEDRIHVDVVDEDGEDVEPGEEGQVVVTKLVPVDEDTAMPLVRYHNGDVARLERRDDCDHGTPGTTALTDITRDGWKTSLAGVEIDPATFERLLYDADTERQITGFQLTVGYDDADRIDRLTVSVETRDEEA